MESWQDLASRSRASARKSDEDAARFHERVGDEVVRRFWLLPYSAPHCITLRTFRPYHALCYLVMSCFKFR